MIAGPVDTELSVVIVRNWLYRAGADEIGLTDEEVIGVALDTYFAARGGAR